MKEFEPRWHASLPIALDPPLGFPRRQPPGGQWRIQDFPNGGALFCRKWGAHILFSGKKCMKLKEIGLKWGGTRLLGPCYSKITIFL